MRTRLYATSDSMSVGVLPMPGEFSRTAGKTPSRHILVIDQEPLTRWSLAEILTEAGHDVVVAADAQAAHEAVVHDPTVDVVLLDGDLPDSQDFKLLSDLRLCVPRARIILMTALGTPALVQGALCLGASRVLEKPFDMTDLPALVS